MTESTKDEIRVAIVGLLTSLLNDSRNITGIIVVSFRDGKMTHPAYAGVTPQQIGSASSIVQAVASQAFLPRAPGTPLAEDK